MARPGGPGPEDHRAGDGRKGVCHLGAEDMWVSQAVGTACRQEAVEQPRGDSLSVGVAW